MNMSVAQATSGAWQRSEDEYGDFYKHTVFSLDFCWLDRFSGFTFFTADILLSRSKLQVLITLTMAPV